LAAWVDRMHVISRKKLRVFWAVHADAKVSLDACFRVVRKVRWKDFVHVRATFNSADQVGPLTVFDIGGNKYRLIAEIIYRRGKVYVRHVLTHKEYSKGKWKI
jgi:mRNA interferase HigB